MLSGKQESRVLGCQSVSLSASQLTTEGGIWAIQHFSNKQQLRILRRTIYDDALLVTLMRC